VLEPNGLPLTVDALMALPFARRQSAVAGLVVANLGARARERIFPGLPSQITDKLVANPHMRSRILRIGISERLPMPESDISHTDVVYLMGKGHSEEPKLERAAAVLALLLKLSRLKGVLGREDVRELIKIAGEEELAFGWSNVQLRQNLATDPELSAVPEEDYPALASKTMQTLKFNMSSWWSQWVDPPSPLTGALKEAAIAAYDWTSQRRIAA
jgi:hypothetical protein